MTTNHLLNSYDYKPLAKFLNGKMPKKVNQWGLELATYNITFEWISGAKNKAADCLSKASGATSNHPQLQSMCLQLLNQMDPPSTQEVQTRQDSTSNNSTTQANTTPDVSPDSTPTQKTLTEDRLEALLQMQKTDPFCKCISKHLSNGKAPQHERDVFTHVKGLRTSKGTPIYTAS